MADSISMSWEDLEALASNFSTNSGSLSDLHGTVEALKTTIVSSVEQYQSDFTNHANTMNGIMSSLKGIVESIVNGSWTGNQANEFADYFNSTLQPCLTNLETSLNNFSTAFQKLAGDFTEEIEPLNQTVQASSETCDAKASFVRSYSQAHQEIDNQ